MWPFLKKKKQIWKWIDESFLREERTMPTDPWDSMNLFHVYAVKYKDLNSGEEKIEEESRLVW